MGPVTVLLPVILLMASVSAAVYRDELALRSELLEKYKYFRSLNIVPLQFSEGDDPLNATSKVKVDVGLSFLKMLSFDEEKNVLSGLFWTKLMWTDSLLRWNKDDFGGIDMLTLPSEWVWRPDIRLYNSLSIGTGMEEDIQVVLFSTGALLHVKPSQFTLPCSCSHEEGYSNVEWECTLKMGSWVHDGLVVDVAMMDDVEQVDLSEYVEDTKYAVTKNSAARHEKYYPGVDKPYPVIDFTLGLKHR